jgi:uncharacterized protein (DUF433 family)
MRLSVSSFEESRTNILTYMVEVVENPDLAARLSQHPSWYAVPDGDGGWLFGPSKFIGYRDARAQTYLQPYDRGDGRETEPTLQQWFVPVDPETALGRDLRNRFATFAAGLGKSPNARWRVAVPRDHLAERPATPPPRALLERIAFDPEILGGKPHIKGTRVGVAHILASLATGESIEEIVEELPWLTSDDVKAALHYAVANIDHPVLVAA